MISLFDKIKKRKQNLFLLNLFYEYLTLQRTLISINDEKDCRN